MFTRLDVVDLIIKVGMIALERDSNNHVVIPQSASLVGVGVMCSPQASRFQSSNPAEVVGFCRKSSSIDFKPWFPSLRSKPS